VKTEIETIPLVYPVPVVLVAVMRGADVNVTTIGDCGIMGLRPPLVYVSLHAHHYSTGGIEESLRFSINIPHAGMVEETDVCGMVSGRDHNKADLFRVEYPGPNGVPVLTDCPVSLICSVREKISIEHRRIFIADVKSTWIESDLLSGDRLPGLLKLKPLIYHLDNHYYTSGEVVSEGYSADTSSVPLREQ